MKQHYPSIEHYLMASVKHLESADFDMMQRDLLQLKLQNGTIK